MIDHWNGLELEITDFDYQDDRTPSLKHISLGNILNQLKAEYKCFHKV